MLMRTRSFFVADLAGVVSYIPALLGALAAGLIVLLDTTIWLSMCFAFAGPMILSGLYEALLDNRVLEFLREKIQNKRLTLDMRCRCLMLILIGNLDLALEPRHAPPRRGSRARHVPPGSGLAEAPDMGALSRDMSADSRLERGMDRAPQVHLGGLGLPGDVALMETPTDRFLARTPTPGEATTSSADHDAITAHPTVVPYRQRLAPYASHSPRPETLASQDTTARTINRRPTAHMAASPWRHMEVLLYDLRLYDDDDHIRNESPRQWPRHLCEEGTNCSDAQHIEHPRPRTREMEGLIARTKTRLRTMLHCQSSFGSMVGAPVIFFLGGFVFAFLSSLDNLGDEDIAESVAFGSWYMIIPHIAIVSGLLLAGNNPNILEGVFATERDEEPDPVYVLGLRFELVYPSCYKVAWQWLRGHTKKQWINQLLRSYERRADVDYTGQLDYDDDMADLRAKTTLSPLDWFLVLLLTSLLIGVPYILAFLTAYYTPQIGLSCRSLTLTVYICLQVAQIFLWIWAYAGAPPARVIPDGHDDTARRPLDFFRKGGWLHRSGFYSPTQVSWLLIKGGKRRPLWEVLRSRELWSRRAAWCITFHVLQVVFGLSAIFASLGGTLMQIMGVYRTSLCYTNTQYWLLPRDRKPMVVLSTNSEEMIRNAVGESSHPELGVCEAV